MSCIWFLVIVAVMAEAIVAGIPKGDKLCTIAKRLGVTSHTSCLPRTADGLTAEQERQLLSRHNALRAGVEPPAANMQKMVWDESIADLAQRWAESCIWDHDKAINREVFGHFTAGQNMWKTKGYLDPFSAARLWHNEFNLFTYNGTNIFQQVGHYTQIVWDETMRLGCGAADCGEEKFLVCNYSPAGNLVTRLNLPYTAGDRGSACPYIQTPDKLCDCGGKYCFGEGELNIEDCSCNCRMDSETNDPNNNCKLICPDPIEPIWNGTYCDDHSALGRCTATWLNSAYCPVTCDTCNHTPKPDPIRELNKLTHSQLEAYIVSQYKFGRRRGKRDLRHF